MRSRRLVVVALILAVIVVVGFIVFGVIIPGSEQSKTSGTLPAFTSQFGDIKTKAKTAAPTSTTGAFNDGNAIKLVSFVQKSGQAKLFQGFEFTSCTEQRGSTATPKAPATKAATPAATEAASAATADAVAGEPDFIVLRIVPEESEACYQVGEVFFNQRNAFNLAIGVTKAIVGEIAIDRANLSNSKIGDITVDISQLRSDESMRDGRIRRDWLESNKYPLAKFTEARAIGLPARALQDGEVLTFQIVGMMQVREVKKELTFDVTASLTGDTLTGTATTDVKMTDFGFEPPSIAGMLRANDEVHIVFNFVAREPAS
jgi:polyisoprenoid-binding protein YceI